MKSVIDFNTLSTLFLFSPDTDEVSNGFQHCQLSFCSVLTLMKSVMDFNTVNSLFVQS